MSLRRIQQDMTSLTPVNDIAGRQPADDPGAVKRRVMVARLRRRLDVLERRGLSDAGRAATAVLPFDIADIDTCLPGGGLALAAIHEVTCGPRGTNGGTKGGANGGSDPHPSADLSSEAATVFFTAHLAARRSRYLPGQSIQCGNGGGNGRGTGTVLWICRRLTPHGPGLVLSGLSLAQTIFVRVADDAAALWAMEEALKCRALSAVVAEVRRLSLTASRRLQLAAESHGVTGLLLRPAYSDLAANAVHSRWRIASAASAVWHGDGMGLSNALRAQLENSRHPLEPPPRAMGPHCLEVALLRVRGGGQGQWTLQWSEKEFAAGQEIKNETGSHKTHEEGAFHLATPLAGGPPAARAGAARFGRRVGA